MNYTVLVVDDEETLRRTMIERVDWEAAGFTVIGEAENGVEALDLVELLEPDLILTDIRMPMISGLELAAKVREMRPATQIVILSGYDSFEYARAAIDYNIISYLLKPISSSEMSAALIDIRRKMDEKVGTGLLRTDENLRERIRRLSVNEFLMPLMLGSGEERTDDEALLAEARRLDIVPEAVSSPVYCVLISKFKQADGSYLTNEQHIDFLHNILSRYMHAETFIVFQRAVTLVVADGQTDLPGLLELPLLEVVQTAKRLFEERCTIGVSRSFTSLSQCSDAYFQAITARRYTSDGVGEVRFINDQEHNVDFEADRAEKTAVRLEQYLKVGPTDELEEFIQELYENSTPENANLLIFQIIATVCRVVRSVSEGSDPMGLLAANPLFSRMTSYSSEEVMKKEILSFCKNAKELISSSQKRDSEILCDRVVHIIDERYSDETLSLTGVSQELAVSPNYLSTLIKKTKKKNFITLLTEKRMQAAYDMLVCTNMRVLEIAEKCGYSDQHYFSYCIKKFYGDSPNHIRAASRGEDK